jgi:hypothetical protein
MLGCELTPPQKFTSTVRGAADAAGVDATSAPIEKAAATEAAKRER